MREFNPVVESMPRSGIRVMLDAASALNDVIHLEIGQPDLPTPEHILRAASNAALQGETSYTSNAGLWQLREAFAKRITLDHQVRVEPDEVVVTVGAMGALYSTMAAILQPGDELLVPDPGYPNYIMTASLFGVRTVAYVLVPGDDHRYHLDWESLERGVSSRTRALVINSPSNPTGHVISRQERDQVLAFVDKYGLFLISDESYDHIIFDGTEHYCPMQMARDSVISIFSCSKSYSMTGLRIGCAVSNRKAANLLAKIQETYVACAPSLSQWAAVTALTGSQECVEVARKRYQSRRDHVAHLCEKLSLEVALPAGAFYVMIRLPENNAHDSRTYALDLLYQEGVAVAPGVSFGLQGEGRVRLSLCADTDMLERGIRAMARFNRIHGSEGVV